MVYPKLSIITPNYNNDIYLEDTIKSVLNQNYPNLEYIIIDGGSTDNSCQIIKKYENRLAYWVSEKDDGIYNAIQKGFEKSTGEIMGWINSDDLYHPHSLFLLAEMFNTFPNVRWLSGTATTFDNKGRTIIAQPARVFSKYDFYNRDFGWIQQESTFWRRSLWDEAGSAINTDLKYAGDFDLWLRFFRVDKLYTTSVLIGGFRWWSRNQLSINNKRNYLEEVESVYRKLDLTDEESTILKKYKKFQFLIGILQKFKIFRTDWVIARFKNRYFEKVEKIVYCPDQYCFEIRRHKF